MTVKMKKPGISWLFVDAGFQFGSIFLCSCQGRVACVSSQFDGEVKGGMF